MEKVTWSNYGMLQPYFSDRVEILRFAALPTFLIKYKYQYEIKDGVLFLYRVGSMFGNKFSFMGFPPFALNNDVEAEGLALKEKLREIPVILSTEEVKKYGITKKDYRFTSRLIEYYCPLQNFINLSGKTWRSWRRAVKRVDEDYESEYISSYVMDNNYMVKGLLRQTIYRELLNLTKEWSKTHTKYAGLNLYLDDFFAGKLDTAVLMILRDKAGRIRQYKLSQKISFFTAFMVDSKSLIEENRYNLMKVGLIKTIDFWKDSDENIIFNLGSGKVKGYKEAKESLRPEILRMYKVSKK